MKVFSSPEGDIYKIGTNAAENWGLLAAASEKDLFFHLTSFPSGYVILQYRREPTEDMIRTGAELCKEATRYRNHRHLRVDYCTCSNIKRGENVGEVEYRSNRKVRTVKV